MEQDSRTTGAEANQRKRETEKKNGEGKQRKEKLKLETGETAKKWKTEKRSKGAKTI